MLIETANITDRYEEGLTGLSNISYNKFAKELYSLQSEATDDDDKLLLLLYALNSWDNRPGAVNIITTQQMLNIMDTISKVSVSPLGSLILTVNKDCCGCSDSKGNSSSSSNSDFEISDTSTVNLSLVNKVLSAMSKISADAGNIIEAHPDGLFADPGTPAATTPFITSPPANETVEVGSDVNFNVVATGTPTLTYQWKKSGTNLTNGGNVSGATTAVLTLTAVSGGDEASYICTVTNDQGTTDSLAGVLTTFTAGSGGGGGSFIGTPDLL